jgi:hypothetical protein
MVARFMHRGCHHLVQSVQIAESNKRSFCPAFFFCCRYRQLSKVHLGHCVDSYLGETSGASCKWNLRP